MDSLVCQAYYNQALIIVLHQLIVGDPNEGTTKNKRFKIQDTDFSHVQTSNLYHIPVPKYYHGKQFGKLFDNLTTRRHMIPLGLYRQQNVNLSIIKDSILQTAQVKDHNDPKANTKKMIKYVVTNPKEDTKLQEDDLVFVLARHNPGDPDLWDEFD